MRRRGTVTRRLIIEAADDLFYGEGVRGASVDAVAKRAGVTGSSAPGQTRCTPNVRCQGEAVMGDHSSDAAWQEQTNPARSETSWIIYFAMNEQSQSLYSERPPLGGGQTFSGPRAAPNNAPKAR